MTTHRLLRAAPDNEPTNHDPCTALLTTLHELLPPNPDQPAAHHHTRFHTFGT